jgi:radical SAM protein with 4Fe4S-binding SPASM domain
MAECLVRDGSMSEFLDRLHPAERRIPLFGTLEITFRCNLTCAHCYVNRGRNDTAEIERELPLDRHLQLMDEYAAAGCLSLLLTGGEPLLRPDFLDLYRAAVVRGFRVSVFTNATLIDGSILRLFQKYPPAAVEVTLYGRTPETYERITGVPGSFERCRAGIEQLRVGGVRLKLKTMVMQWNEHEIEAIRRYAGELGISFRHDGLLNSRFDCGVDRNRELQLCADRLVATDFSDPSLRRRWLASAQAVLGKGTTSAPGDFLYSCGGGYNSFTVDPYGHLLLCLLSRRSTFDLRNQSFRRGWEEFLPAIRARRRESESACRVCTLLPICQNCPGVAEIEQGDPEAQIETCCRLTHLRVHTLLGDACGHRPDARCCLNASSTVDRSVHVRTV